MCFLCLLCGSSLFPLAAEVPQVGEVFTTSAAKCMPITVPKHGGKSLQLKFTCDPLSPLHFFALHVGEQAVNVFYSSS